MTPEQEAKFMEIIDHLEKEKGSPPSWHQIRKYMFEHQSELAEFECPEGVHPLMHAVKLLMIRGPVSWTDKIYYDKTW